MYKFGEYQLDQLNFKLTQKGEDVEVEPQVFKTLLMLVENRERVVPKHELLEQVWEGRVVTDQVITRIIYELRKIFSDKSGHSTYIRTVRGQGYQFVAEVVEDSQADLNKIDEKSSPTPSKPKLLLNKKPLFAVLMITVVLIYGIYFLINQTNKTADSSAKRTLQQQSEYPIIALLPIEVEAGNEELSMLVESLIEYLSNQLAVNLNMKVIHPDNLKHLGNQLENIWMVQQATRSDYLIKGYIESVTDKNLKLHLILYKNNTEDELIPYKLGAFEFPYPKNVKELNNLYKQRKVTVRSIIQIIKPGIAVKDDGEYETTNPQAYRMVIAAHHMSRNDDCNDLKLAEDILLRAVQSDPGFAYAYYQLFANYFKRVWLCGESIEFHQKALAMAQQVELLAPNTYQAMYKGMNSIYVESNQVEKAYELSEDANWNDPDALNHKNYGLRYAGFLEAASQNLNRILQLDPFYFSEKPINQAPNTLMYQNRFSQYLELLAEPGNSYHDYYRGLSLALTDQTSQAKKVLQGVVKRKSAGIFDEFSQALLLILNDDEPAAIDIINAIANQRVERKHSDGEMNYKLVQLYALAGSPKKALKYLKLSVDQGFFPMNYFLIDPALESIRKTQLFTEIVLQATQRHLAFADRFELKPETKLDVTKQK